MLSETPEFTAKCEINRAEANRIENGKKNPPNEIFSFFVSFL